MMLNTPVKSKTRELGRLPEEWSVMKAGQWGCVRGCAWLKSLRGMIGLPCDLIVKEEDCSAVLVWALERDARPNQIGPTCVAPTASKKGFQVAF